MLYGNSIIKIDIALKLEKINKYVLSEEYFNFPTNYGIELFANDFIKFIF